MSLPQLNRYILSNILTKLILGCLCEYQPTTGDSTIDLITVADLYESLCKFFLAEREKLKFFVKKGDGSCVAEQYTTDIGKRQQERKDLTKCSMKKLERLRVKHSGLTRFSLT
ncbi:hypothetical protein WA026_022355 [Henosepilachna vigintioctopunctata]|uniref:Uncharacterized protein n=1 Tax=Henosepilachna vigintioctopunctata TaxID=420089 RepID=A0AAW1V5F8_9CUCU